jgi:hypothetical protein
MTVIGFNMLLFAANLSFVIAYHDNLGIGSAADGSAASGAEPPVPWLGWVLCGLSFWYFWGYVGVTMYRGMRCHGPSNLALLFYHYPRWTHSWSNAFFGGGDLALQAATCAAQVRAGIEQDCPDIAALLAEVEGRGSGEAEATVVDDKES